jgi:hypothetical protein
MSETLYHFRSGCTSSRGGPLGFLLATDAARGPVSLKASVRNSPSFAKCMLALHDVVASDLRYQSRNRGAYLAWVEQQYLAELDQQHAELYKARKEIADEFARITSIVRTREGERSDLLELCTRHDSSIWEAKRRYFKYLLDTDVEQWRVLDPVISVHPDATLFEGFSLDESSYGRVTAPMENLEVRETPTWGTTNIDFSESLAQAFERVRSYRPAVLDIGGGQVSAGTASRMAIEKKVDLPPSWVRGFVQVQSASAMKGITVYLSAETVARVIAVLRQRRERQGPRSLQFTLRLGQKPRITIEPWGIEVDEWQHVYDGAESAVIRIWGRRRLFCLERLLPHVNQVEVRLLGTGMPSYWSVELEGHRFDLGLSGWTSNDWASQARFAALSAPLRGVPQLVKRAREVLEQQLVVDVAGLADALRSSRPRALSVLQELCRRGDAMFDLRRSAYRWRQLFRASATEAGLETGDEEMDVASLVHSASVQVLDAPTTTSRGNLQYRCVVEIRKPFHPVLDIDSDGRVVTATCTCSFFRRNKLRLGPCAHMLAAVGYISQTPVVGGAKTT